jgi:putative cardiolipin synthase
MIVDKRMVFVGSMNLDPRSVGVNSEMGVVVESPGLGRIAASAVEEALKPENSWRVVLDPDGGLRWVAGTQVRRFQPARSFWDRVQDLLYMVFPRQLY